MSKEKARYFTFLLYPESIPNDWELKLEMLGVPMAISPLHDKDKSNVEGQKYKKEHYHVIYVSKNPVTPESVRLKIKRTLGDKSVAMVQIISMSMENMYLHLTHESKDAVAKNKHKYKRSDIKLINNFDIDRYITLDVEDKEDLFNEICDIIDDHDLANMRELKNFVKYHGAEYGLPSMKVIRSVMKMSSGIIRLTFDAVYQERRYGKQID
ncbi:replication protein RepB, partial [Campylobacter jejuni]|nr:replication protein RepB [Campylobacter jejuni]